jgi:hypothetical protein
MKQQHPIEQANNADLRGSWPALRRAAERARQIAAQTGTAVVVVRDGTVQHIYPTQTLPPTHDTQEASASYGKPA